MRLFILFFTLFLVVAAKNPATAAHILGGELTYEALPDNDPFFTTYRFKLVLYRNCNTGGANFDFPAEIAIYRGSAASFTLEAAFETGEPVTEMAGLPAGLCIQRGTYTFLRVLPVLENESYLIVYQRCCRPPNIINLMAPLEVGFTIQAELTPAGQAADNNGAVFTPLPQLWFCNNTPLDFASFTATDADGDSLVYDFCAPLNGGGPLLQPTSELQSCQGAMPAPPCAPPYMAVPFASPEFSAGDPLGPNGQLTVNAATGQITGQAAALGSYAIGVCVREYRNGVLLNTTLREISLAVLDCTINTSEAEKPMQRLHVRPNPADQRLELQFDTRAPGQLTVSTADGRAVVRRDLPAAPGGQTLELDVSAWPAGWYWLHWQGAGQGQAVRVFVQH